MAKLNIRDVIEALRSTSDPEAGLDIVKLGLVYGVELGSNGDILVRLAMTSPACPSANSILAEVHKRIGSIPGAGMVTVELVWNPPWTPDMIDGKSRGRISSEAHLKK